MNGKDLRDLTVLCVAGIVAIVMVLAATSCTKQVPVRFVETKTKIVRVEVPSEPLLQRCRAPKLPPPPDTVSYKCKKGHLCFDAKNKAKLEYFVGLMLAHINWLEVHCTEQRIADIIEDQPPASGEVK